MDEDLAEKPQPTCRFWNEDGRLDLWVHGGVVLAEVAAPDGALAVQVPLDRLERAVVALGDEDRRNALVGQDVAGGGHR